MAKYHDVKVTFSYFQLNKIKSAANIATDLIFRLSSGMTGADETNFLHNFLKTNRQVPSLWKIFANSSERYKITKDVTIQNNTVAWIPW